MLGKPGSRLSKNYRQIFKSVAVNLWCGETRLAILIGYIFHLHFNCLALRYIGTPIVQLIGYIFHLHFNCLALRYRHANIVPKLRQPWQILPCLYAFSNDLIGLKIDFSCFDWFLILCRVFKLRYPNKDPKIIQP